MFYNAFVFFGWAIGLITLTYAVCKVTFDPQDTGEWGAAAFFGICIILFTCGVQDFHAKHTEVPQETSQVQAEKPLGVQGEYRIVFNERLGTNQEPAWEFQKWHNHEWVVIKWSDDKVALTEYAQTYVDNVQAKSQVIIIKKEMKPVLSDSTKEAPSAIEVQ